MTALTVGTPLPDFTAAMTSDKTFRLSDFYGKQALVLYFYPKDNTSACTKEGLDFSAYYAAFQAAETAIVGISRDSLKSHENFKAKYNFPFELLADPEEQICQLFDVIKLKNRYGKQVRGIERSTFLIDQQGILRQAWRNIRVKDHVAAVLTAAQAL